MSTNSDHYQKELIKLLTLFATNVVALNEQGKTDLAKSAELLYKDLLPLIFKQTFNSPIRVNNETFDLSGEAVGKKKVIVQVTSRSDAAKIKDTLTGLPTKWPGTKPNQLFFVLIGLKPKYQKKTFESCHKDFKYNEQILGISQLVARITSEGLSAIKLAYEIAERHLNPQGPNPKIDNERLLGSVRFLQKEMFESKAKISKELEFQTPINGHDDSLYKSALMNFQNLLEKWSLLLKDIHQMVNSKIDQAQDSLRQIVDGVAYDHVVQMGIFHEISLAEGRARELALLISQLTDSKAAISSAQEELRKLETEKEEIAKEMASLRFEILMTDPDSPLLLSA